MNIEKISLLLFVAGACLPPATGMADEVYVVGQTAASLPPGIYVGAGYTYYAEHFQGALSDILHNTGGFTIRAGYRVTEDISLEAVYQYYDEFRHRKDVTSPEWWYLVSTSGIPSASGYLETVTVTGYDITVNAKATLPFGFVRPYGIIGLGFGRSRLKVTEEGYTAAAATYSGSEVWTGCLGRVGVGCDLHVIGGLGLAVEAVYNAGFGDLQTLRFVSLSAGACYLF